MITWAQIHAARALLGWSVRDLARRAVVSIGARGHTEPGILGGDLTEPALGYSMCSLIGWKR